MKRAKAKPANDGFRSWLTRLIRVIEPRLRTEVAEGRPIAPALLVFSREDEMKVIPVDMEDGEQKTALFQLMRDLAAHDKIVKAVVLITEAWSLTTGSKDYDGESIEHTPGRTEIVLLSAIMSNMQMIAKAPIDRLGNVSILGIFEIESGEKLKGRMALD